MDLTPTPAQTVGPFFGFALPFEGGEQLVDRSHPAAVRLHGTVFDGHGTPIPDAMIEIWQADETGRVPQEECSLNRDGYTFTGWGRAAVDNNGHYSFTTVEPGATRADTAPYILVTVFARGLMDRLYTRAYLPVSPQTLETDSFLASVPAHRRTSLISTRDEQGNLRFDIHLQGEHETVFLSYPNTPQVTGPVDD